MSVYLFYVMNPWEYFSDVQALCPEQLGSKMDHKSNTEYCTCEDAEYMPDHVVMGNLLNRIEDNSKGIENTCSQYPPQESRWKVGYDFVPEENNHPSHTKIEHYM